MTIAEIFPNPTVKQVIFQIRFPNLFYIESKIGDLQIKIMKEFPESSMIFRRQIVFVETGEKAKLTDIPVESDQTGKKIWQFKSENNVELNILSDSLDISSKYHKTYNLGTGDKFRDVIESVLSKFFEVVSIPIINRIGLRYVDECPIPAKDNVGFQSYYNSAFPLEKFNLADVDEMSFKTRVKRRDYYLLYKESLQKTDENYKLILDCDGYAVNIKAEDYLKVADDLHTIISEEYEKTIKEPVYTFMRQSGI